MKKLILLSFAVLFFTSINAQTDRNDLQPKDTTPKEATKQKKSNKYIQSWNLPNRKWFVEIGTPGAGLTLTYSTYGALLNQMDGGYLYLKAPSLTLFFIEDSTSYFGWGYEYSYIQKSISKTNFTGNLQILNANFYANEAVYLSSSTVKYKYRQYQKLSNHFSLNFGIGIGYNICKIDKNRFYDSSNPSIYYYNDELKLESYGLVTDLGVNWEVTKNISIGMRADYDYFKIKIENYTNYGVFDSYSKANFISLSPTIRFKI